MAKYLEGRVDIMGHEIQKAQIIVNTIQKARIIINTIII
jgi:hypothetical protein